jgi:hypothetical protein
MFSGCMCAPLCFKQGIQTVGGLKSAALEAGGWVEWMNSSHFQNMPANTIKSALHGRHAPFSMDVTVTGCVTVVDKVTSVGVVSLRKWVALITRCLPSLPR